MEGLIQELRYAVRMLGRSPGLIAVAVITLALGIGANTAIFSLLNALILRPLPVRAPEQLVRIGPVDRRGLIQPVPGPMFDWLRKDPLLEGVCGVRTPLWTAEVKDATLPIAGHALSGDCYDVLGVRPAIGRLFVRNDDIPNGPLVTVLSYAFWQTLLGGDPNVIGREIRIGGAPFTVIGVTEPRFQGLLLGFPPSASIPITQERADPLTPQKFYWGDAFARLKPKVTSEQLQSRLNVEWRRILDESLPASIQGSERAEMLNQRAVVISGAKGLDYSMRNRFERPLFALLGVSGLVLLISTINIANFLLARGLQRRGEIAVRLALGARRWQIVRQLLVECVILVTAGLGCALLLTYVGDRLVLAVLSRTYPSFGLAASLDVRVLVFTGGTALMTLLLFGVLPARHSSTVNLTGVLKSGAGPASSKQSRVRRTLICAQVALTLALLMSASFFVETLRHLRERSLGFHVEGLWSAQMMPLPGGYARGFNAPIYYRELLERMGHLAGVQVASLSRFSPLFTLPYKEEIRTTRMPGVPPVLAPVERVSDGFLATLQIPLMEGEDFHRTDSPQSEKTAIVSESLGKQLFPARDVLGQHIQVGSEKDTQDVEIVGVASDARLMDPRSQDLGFVYLNYWQYPDYERWGVMQLRYTGDTAELISAVRHELRQVGREYPSYVRTIADNRDISLLQERLLASLGTAFGIVALTLAGVGLFGLLSFFVAQRTGEIGIRMALGAEHRDVSWLIVREALLLVGIGLFIGCPLSYMTTRSLSALLYGATHLPMTSLVSSVIILSAVAGAAVGIPLRRATRVDPIAALRYE